MHPLEQYNRLMEELGEIKDLLAEMNKYRFAEQYVNNDELSGLLKVSKRTLQEWREKGIIPFAALGKKVYYRLSDIEAIFEAAIQKPKHLKKFSKSGRPPLRKRQKNSTWTIRV